MLSKWALETILIIAELSFAIIIIGCITICMYGFDIDGHSIFLQSLVFH